MPQYLGFLELVDELIETSSTRSQRPNPPQSSCEFLHLFSDDGLNALRLFPNVLEQLLWSPVLLPLQQTGSKDDGQVVGTHLVDVLVLCNSVGKDEIKSEEHKREQPQL